MYFYLLNKLDFNSSMNIEINWASEDHFKGKLALQRTIILTDVSRWSHMADLRVLTNRDAFRIGVNMNLLPKKMTSTFGFSFVTLREFTVEWRKFIASNVLGSGGRASTREHTKRLQRFPVELNTTTIWCEKVCSPTAEMFWVARFMSDRRCLCQRNRARSAKMFIGKAF